MAQICTLESKGEKLDVKLLYYDRIVPSPTLAQQHLMAVSPYSISLYFTASGALESLGFDHGTSVVYDDIRDVLLVITANQVYELARVSQEVQLFYEGHDNILSVLPKNELW